MAYKLAKTFQIQTSTNSTTWTGRLLTINERGVLFRDGLPLQKLPHDMYRMNGRQARTTKRYSLFAFNGPQCSSATPTTIQDRKKAVRSIGTISECQAPRSYYSNPFGGTAETIERLTLWKTGGRSRRWVSKPGSHGVA